MTADSGSVLGTVLGTVFGAVTAPVSRVSGMTLSGCSAKSRCKTVGRLRQSGSRHSRLPADRRPGETKVERSLLPLVEMEWRGPAPRSL